MRPLQLCRRCQFKCFCHANTVRDGLGKRFMVCRLSFYLFWHTTLLFNSLLQVLIRFLYNFNLKSFCNTAFNGDLDKVQSLIDKARNAKDAVMAPDNAGYTALHYAARNGFVDICKVLLQYGADIDAQTKSAGATPLHKAAASGTNRNLTL